ncbi:MAG: hypothetical protein KGI29_08600 [Pseudomonadota bacterium]|nr:hypothetical protein [Pseudomonadota bacterium]MDE3037813.1 hypothetical protein [Pseudomonadota bacterium]
MSMETYVEENRGGAILRFPRRRGRPRTTQRNHDTGTPELVMKRLLGETAEALDLCLERGIITQQQHWCGIHLRWLYTLRYGAPGVRAIDPTHLGGLDTKIDDPLWRGAREKEFHEAMAALAKSGHAPLMMNVCIYNERPRFLSLHKPVKPERCRETSKMIDSLRDGLDVLSNHWHRKD